MFDVWFEDKNKEKQYVWQTSWGFSTRSIGSMIMIHSDNKGLVLPPRVAQIQVVLVPIISSKDDDPKSIYDALEDVYQRLKASGVRVHIDDRDNYNPGWKFNHWEVKGVPIRIELGKKDLQNQEVKIVRRDNAEKQQMKWTDLTSAIPVLLETIQEDMYQRALKTRDEHLKK
jgi:prolyl-tRNA synthetase